MEKPDLNRMWETFIRIGLANQVPVARVIHMIRFNVYPMISDLRDKKIIDWHFFLIHNWRTGVPTTPDDKNLYFHIRFTVNKDIEVKNEKDVDNLLPNYCVMTRKIKRKRVENIHMSKTEDMDKSLFRNEKIEEAWKIMGEQSEWVMNMLNIHKKEVEVPVKHIGQFLHYYFNMFGGFPILVKCPNCGHVFPFSF